ncbi:TIGR04283 family arsenosugar biosynthesis glycosyltransferase [Parvularcula dongshanensis]|uniref:Glycosyltransferase 2-like domain-containing protein n=1 Tax=Parvularcula dongshanensis TaxID=1173995 RepID=A0A840I0M6_9PROT|nr:hypothetical protein [Parvularcula dongshanensis]
MISVVIPTLNARDALPETLACLWDANADGLVREVIVTDGGSADETLAVADAAGCQIVAGGPGRGSQLGRGAEAARGEWLLFLHADTVLSPEWEGEVGAFCARDEAAGAFRLAFARKGIAPRLVAAGANLRTRTLGLPYGDQGLLISRARYERIGGFAPLPLFEDVDIARRIVADGGRGALRLLASRAVTSPARYEQAGYVRRVLRNQWCLLAYLRGVPTETIAARYA